MEASLTGAGVTALLGLGLIFGLKHATEVDHVVAVSTIVSEHRSVWRSAIIGGLWGAGHTAALLVVGLGLLVFRLPLPALVATGLEFGVALMIIGLGGLTVVRVLRRRADVHIHRHTHDGESHVHFHFHEQGTEHERPGHSAPIPAKHTHEVSRLGLKPVLVGAMHGLAGSAGLTLLVLTQIESVGLGMLYLGVFGLGSTLGMLLMSSLIGLPFVFSGKRFSNINQGLQAVAGCLSIAFGFWYAYQVSSG
jgi:ABC-type nickel/cobalt efflux system permease component RcnA